ncbi:hypothetical protein MGA3_07640 [Bacillus methanolicus MGA3]|nr:hypothetical protein MGA3_07640 [Bacillus methanolicus MGA3]
MEKQILLLGLLFITEGAIQFAAADPLRSFLRLWQAQPLQELFQ